MVWFTEFFKSGTQAPNCVQSLLFLSDHPFLSEGVYGVSVIVGGNEILDKVVCV